MSVRVFQNETFTCFDDRDSGRVFEDLEFRNCQFNDCKISVTDNLLLRSTVRRVLLIGCRVNAGTIGTAIVEESAVDGLRIAEIFQTFGAVFKHVTLRGKIDRLMLVNDILPPMHMHKEFWDDEIAKVRAANLEYYRHVDWALDISQGEFKELDIRGIPGDLIRRDPATQILVRREQALEGRWKSLPLHNPSLWELSFNMLLERGDSDMVFVAPKRDRSFQQDLADLQLLREAGVAEPD